MLAETVASGANVDWQQEADGTTDERRRQVLEELQVLERLMEVHGVEPDRDRSAEPRGRHEPNARRRWGRFELRERLGGSGLGIVYRTWDPTLERDVALKLLDGPPIDRSAYLEDLYHLARVRHPNILAVYGTDAVDGISGFWTELVRGHTLAEIRRVRGVLDVEGAVCVADALGSALSAVHAAGLVHRNVTAENVMREPDGRLVLMEPGARAAGSEQPRWGAPCYTAPEVLALGPASPRSDIYSLGVLLFFLLTGESPHADHASVNQSPRGASRRLLEVRPDVSAGLQAVIKTALAHDPDARFTTADRLRVALHGGGR